MRSTDETIDLKPSWLRLVAEILREHVPGAEVRVFGSRVSGTAKSYSDLDLAVVALQRLTLRALGQLLEAFQESDLPIRVEVVDWHTLPVNFRASIEQHFVVIQRPTADGSSPLGDCKRPEDQLDGPG